MIYTLTLNPAIDYMLYVDSLACGNILRSRNERIFFGGKGINVSLILKELGIPSVATGFTAGFTGEALEKGISCEKIKADFIRLEEGITRINVKIRSGEETDINASGPKINEEAIVRLFEKLDALNNGDFLVMAGSVPSSMPQNTYEIIMQRLYKKGVKFIVDAEGELLANSLKYKPFLIKPNLQELSGIFGTDIATPKQAEDYALRLLKTGAQNVLVSMGEKGALLLDSNGERHFSEALKGEFINSVGAGDSMLAGFLAGFAKTGDYEYALRLGTAAGGATAFSEGLASAEQIAALCK